MFLLCFNLIRKRVINFIFVSLFSIKKDWQSNKIRNIDFFIKDFEKLYILIYVFFKDIIYLIIDFKKKLRNNIVVYFYGVDFFLKKFRVLEFLIMDGRQ